MPRRPFCGGLIVPASAALDASHSSFLACKEQKDLFVSAVSCLVYCQKTSIVIPSMPPHSFFFFFFQYILEQAEHFLYLHFSWQERSSDAIS